MVMKKILIALALLLTGIASGSACTGISFLAEDGGYVQARTIEWGDSYLPSEYVIVPRGQDLVSYTPTGVNGLRFRAKYGLVGLAIIQKEFVAEGLNEVGLSAGLFYFPHYGKVSIRPRACFFPLFSFLPLWLHYNLNPLCVQY